MSLVLYPDSDSDPDLDDATHHQQPESAQPPPSRQSGGPNSLKRKLPDQAKQSSSSHSSHSSHRSELPPLPSAFHDLYSANARISTSDDPTLHGGRKRAIPHVEGNWPSHVYLEWVPSQAESDHLLNLIHTIQEVIERTNALRTNPLPVPDITPSLLSPLGAPLPLHISLSRTLQIKTEDRNAFLATLTAALRKSQARPFDARFTALKWVPNYERNRWFLVLGIEKPPHDDLNKLLVACNTASETYGYPGLYTGGSGDGPMEGNTSTDNIAKRRKTSQPKGLREDTVTDNSEYNDRFHVSIAWNLVEPEPEWISLAAEVDVAKLIDSPANPFDAVKARIGNTVHSISLAAKPSAVVRGGGILGLG